MSRVQGIPRMMSRSGAPLPSGAEAALRRGARGRLAEGLIAGGDELDGEIVPHHARRTSLYDPSEPVPHPPAGLLGGLDREVSRRQLASPQGLEPDAVGLLADGVRELGPHARPYVLQLGAHGSVNPLLLGRK